ncbi:hypothetical protein EJ04DRAFT_190243 [Polyplosphaeria fusca]|uniref:Uncharacterized protein n=1 Tax=Polyplosphaeria fusca TaxID=682080 RepID=A0A9P4R248_9PLEO|nr:hypothetical protein EJ04DRAFT_190243 [Polyplosphaeria fusca]
MKINPAPLHIAQLAIFGLSAAMSIAILGTAAHTLDVFNKQQSSNPWWLPLWPQHFDVQGTKALIGSSTTTFVLCIAFIVLTVIPQLNLAAKPTLRALLSLCLALPSALLTLVTVIYTHILNNDSPDLDTIQTWTCKYKNAQPLDQDMALPTNMGNGNFGSLCKESKFALYGTLVVFLMLSANMGLSVVTWLADKWSARQTRKEAEMAGVQS